PVGRSAARYIYRAASAYRGSGNRGSSSARPPPARRVSSAPASSEERRQVARQQHALIEIDRAPQHFQRGLLAAQHVDTLADEEIDIVLQAKAADDEAALHRDIAARDGVDPHIGDQMRGARARLLGPMIAPLDLQHALLQGVLAFIEPIRLRAFARIF